MKLPITLASLAALGTLLAFTQARKPVVVAEYATPLKGRTQGQRHNALLAGYRLNGVVIEDGATFSFNEVVKSWSKDQGYVRAPVSFNGQLVSAYGGGVCQTSTTLYNAALLAGMHVVERSRHHFAPTYCPPGRDSAVAFSSIDLKLKNTTGTRLRIQVKPMGDRLVVQLLADREIPQATVTQVVHQKTDPSTFRLEGDNPRLRNSGKPGFDVSVFRTTSKGKELISHDLYPAMHRIEEGG